ncbi:ABC transporter permease [Aliiruegeria sabulilitoris]|uniref:ABC transporter permease n=1 Tax=Aliiruegeria sabulilitoris TaxID=1510458 RepID=UPI0008372F9D|nr:ABC transporter permease [Aliiruegeria sabulilitoris]NDR55430.1 ABC transporter permease [Pseudoruegeria sp. M32A2M]
MNIPAVHTPRLSLSFLVDHFFYLVFLLVFVFFSLASDKFLTVSNLSSLLLQCSYYGVLVTGLSFVIISGDFDISVGTVAYVSMSVGMVTIAAGYPILLGVALTLLTGVAIGLLNALIIIYLHVPAFITTLGVLIAGRGVGHLLVAEQGGIEAPVALTQFAQFRIGPLYLEVAFMLLVMFIGQFVLTRTAFGRTVFAIGDNEKSARRIGIEINKMKLVLFTLSGFVASLAGLVYVTQVGYLHASFADGWEFTAISMAVIGGVSLFGGRGTILPGALLGITLIVMLQNGLTIIGLSPYIHPFVIGSMIFVAILADSLKNRRN